VNKRILIATLANDPHTQGLFNFTRIAREAGFDVLSLSPGSTAEEILENIRNYDPEFIGFSYRLSPEIGLEHMSHIIHRISENNLLIRSNGEKREIAFAGLPATVELVFGSLSDYHITGIKQSAEPLDSVGIVLDYLGVYDERREKIIKSARERLTPPRIKELDSLAELVTGDVSIEPPLDIPSDHAKKSYTARIREVWPGRPIIRTHYGEPGETIAPTITGIEKIAEAAVIDEISLGSSDLSQRYYNEPDKWSHKKNDGGVPYKNLQDLLLLREAARRGNYPSVKPYSHVVNMESFVDECIKAGMLTGSHQAVPLFWFNKMDGRGPVDVSQSIKEHISTVKKLTGYNIPVEMNDPNHWSSRWASDAVVVADYGLIASVMIACGVSDMVLQMQFNKPKETGDYGDIAKFLASLELVKKLIPASMSINVWIEARTGIEHFKPDLEVARKQLARSTLLQMLLNPHALHLVSYCEALYAAKPEDIIQSSSIIRKAVKVYHKNKEDLQKYINIPEIKERKEYLLKEAMFLLREIAKLNPEYDKGSISTMYRYLSDGDTLYESLKRGYMSAPGIFTEPFRENALLTHTDIITGGMINSIDPKSLASITEEKRIQYLLRR
jgi:methylmalonyl-CoA mutase cobalamin-binding subunit